jgi:hypothetical protein
MDVALRILSNINKSSNGIWTYDKLAKVCHSHFLQDFKDICEDTKICKEE